MSGPATGSRAFFGGPPWWLLVGVPVALIMGVFVLEALGVPMAPAVLGLFTVLFAGFSVVAVVRRGWPTALRTAVLPSAAGLLVAAAVMHSGLTVTGVQAPWSENTYLPGIAAMVAVQLGLQYLLNRRRGGAATEQAVHSGEPDR